MNIKKSVVFMLVAMAVAMLRAGIATTDALMEVLWYQDAVAQFEAAKWTEGTTVSDGKIAVDSKVTYTPAEQTGTAVRQVFDVDPEPVEEYPEIDADAQTAFVVKDGKLCVWARTTAEGDPSWQELGDRTDAPIALEIDYAAEVPELRFYQGDVLMNADTLYTAKAASKVTSYDFEGTGTIAALSGTQTADTAAMIGTTKYASLEEAIAAYQEGDVINVIKDGQTAPEGWQIADGKLVPAEVKTYVAQIGETKYETLQEALTAGGEVTLLSDLTVSDELVIATPVTLDLGGFTLTCTANGEGDSIWVKGGQSLVLKNGTVLSSQIGIYESRGATVTIESDATVQSTGSDVAYALYMNGSTATVKGTLKAVSQALVFFSYTSDDGSVTMPCTVTVSGTVLSTGEDVAAISGNGTDHCADNAVTINEGATITSEQSEAIYWPNAGTLTINGGTITGGSNGIYAKSGTVDIKGGTITSTATEVVDPAVNNNGSTGEGYALVLEKGTASGGYANGLTASVTGGSFESVGAPVVSWTRDAEAAEALTGFVEGGSFKGAEMPTDLIKVEEGEVASWGEPNEDGFIVAVVEDAPVTVPAASYSLDYNNELNTPSTILGGDYLPSNGDGFDSYTTLRGGDETGVVVGSAGNRKGAYYNQSFVQNGADWSISIVAQTVAAENAVIWSVGGKNTGTKSGIALVRKTTDTVALASWTPSGLTELATATVPLMDRQLHNYIVTFDHSELTYTLYVDGVAGGTATVEAECVFSNAFQAGGVHGGAPTGVNVSTGFIFDELGMWNGTALTADQAAQVASNYPVYPIIRTLVWNNENEDWTDAVQAYADGTETLVDITANDIVVFRNPTKVLYDKRTNKTPVNFVVESGTLKIGHDSNTENNLPADSTVTVNAGAAVELRCWNNDGQGNSVFLPGVTFSGEGRVYLHSSITALHLGVLSGTTPVDLGQGNATVEFNWFKDRGINGYIASPICGKATINAYDGMPALNCVEGENGWKGTVRIQDMVTMSGLSLNAYGIAGSTVELGNIQAGYFLKNETVLPTVKVSGTVKTNNGYYDSVNTFTKVIGSGTLELDKTGSKSSYVIETFGKEFTGTLTVKNVNLTVNAIETTLTEVPTSATTVLAFGEGTDLGNITISDLAIKLADGTDITDQVKVEKTAAGIQISSNVVLEPSLTEGQGTYTLAEGTGGKGPMMVVSVANVSELDILNGETLSEVVVPVGVTQVNGAPNATITVMGGMLDVTEIFTIGEDGSIALNPEASTSGITVKPELNTQAEGGAFVLDETATVVVRTIPGLVYRLLRSDEITTVKSGTVVATVTATSPSTALVDATENRPTDKAFYIVTVDVK